MSMIKGDFCSRYYKEIKDVALLKPREKQR